MAGNKGANPGGYPDAKAVAVESPDGTVETVYEVDLCQLELRVKEAREEADRLEQEVAEARSRQGQVGTTGSEEKEKR